ncbi:hypothetical protein JOF41_000992 [Saccharothrix coeruleofusca]|uniref:hypothetical protein n=1 Tax=Saccharothrix coeruleofusca TaxID=33919 RepID=UPI001AE7EC79|nr:hypothetical protein [Saccharothrix coeruleofusca]MBP2334814.1 hypothetical protein [Saccharothrix coeruleofusca]
MITQHSQPDQYCREALGRLTAEFRGVLPQEVVTGTVLAARRDLEGQVAREALAEMLHHLAHHRLDRLRTGG